MNNSLLEQMIRYLVPKGSKLQISISENLTSMDKTLRIAHLQTKQDIVDQVVGFRETILQDMFPEYVAYRHELDGYKELFGMLEITQKKPVPREAVNTHLGPYVGAKCE